MDEIQPYGREYWDEDWPWGLRCIDCDRPFGEGDRFASRLIGMTEMGDDPAAILEIVCLECALQPVS